MTAARIIIWRHGRTEWNVGDRFQGQADIPIDGVGYAQAVRAAEVLAAYRPTGLYSSDLARCIRPPRCSPSAPGWRSSPTSGCAKFTWLVGGLGRR